MKNAKIAGAVLLAVVLVIVILQNTQSVETKVLFVTLTMPRAVLLFTTLVLGWLLGVLTAVRVGRRSAAA